MNMHLDSYQGEEIKRCENLFTIVEEAFGSKQIKVDRTSVVVVLGNFNFHIDLTEPLIREAITKNNIERLRDNDGLIKLKKVAEQPYLLHDNALNIIDVLKSK